jgi:hypothetical protein
MREWHRLSERRRGSRPGGEPEVALPGRRSSAAGADRAGNPVGASCYDSPDSFLRWGLKLGQPVWYTGVHFRQEGMRD